MHRLVHREDPLETLEIGSRNLTGAQRTKIVAALRGFVGSRRRISFITDLEPLLDTLIHIQDICRPLGV